MFFPFLFFLRGSVIPFPIGFYLLQTGSDTTLITRHHHHHFPTLSLEHLSLSLQLPTLLTYWNLYPKYLGLQQKGAPRVDVMITIFCDFCQFSAKKLAFFSKTYVMIKSLHNLALFWAKNDNFFEKIFGENILKIITSVPVLLFGNFFCENADSRFLRYRCISRNRALAASTAKTTSCSAGSSRPPIDENPEKP
jgi:hypothetical protein